MATATRTSTMAGALADATTRLDTAGIDASRIEAEVLLGHALDMSREAIYARLEEVLDDAAAAAFEGLLERRLAHEPTAYITGRREFYGLEFACTPDALILRPETELVVERALQWLGRHKKSTTSPLLIDVGTGSGAIAVAVAVHAPDARIVAVDASRAALGLARRNAEAHRVAGRIDFVQAPLLAALRGRADVIVANLPYISTPVYAELPPEIREHEPEIALHAGVCGTGLIEALLAQAADQLAPGGLLVAEHAWDQGERLRAAAGASFPSAQIETARDVAGLERALVVEAT